MVVPVLTLALLLMGGVRATRAQDCAAADAAALAGIAAARSELIAQPQSDELDTDVSAATQAGIAHLKDASAALVGARVRCASLDIKPQALERALNAAMQPLLRGCDAHCAEAPYAGVPGFAVTRIDDTRQLLAVQARIGIECGADSQLLIFAQRDGQWRLSLRWQSAPYDKVSGAFEAFDYRISPPDAHGDWFVVVKDIMPWCSSTWSMVRYAVLRPASGADDPHVVFHAQDSIWWGSDDVGRISATATTFDVRFHAASIDPGIHNRQFIRHFAIHGDTVERVQPVAATARDFADEWIVSPWAQAQAWSRAAPDLAQWHARLHGEPEHSPYFEFAAIRACKGAPRRYQVQLTGAKGDDSYFLDVAGSARSFMLMAVSQRADAGCAGRDLLQHMQTK